jgi:hypothetical protein
MADTQEINTIWKELKQLATQTTAIEAEKERLIGWLTFYKNRAESVSNEISRRKESPELYPPAAGAGTIDDLIEETNKLNDLIKDVINDINNFDQPIEDIKESRSQLLFIVADTFGLDTLKKIRADIWKEMNNHNRLQHEAYKAQKERYEQCKHTFGFTPDDRAFIAHHKALNEAHIKFWNLLCDQLTMLCELITELDPSDEDFGLDEA